MLAFARPLVLLALPVLFAYLAWLGRPSRGPARSREQASLVLRLVLVALLIAGLAGAQLVQTSAELAVVYLLDFSDSVGPAGRAAAIDFVERSLAEMGPDDRAGVVVFGEDAVVERPATGDATLAEITSVVNRRATDLAEAIRLGLALFPAGSARRLVLVSDGAQTVHAVDAERAARLAGAAGVRLEVVPLLRESGPEALVAAVTAPPRLHQGEDFTLGVTLAANSDMPARLQAFAGGQLVADQSVELHEGSNTFALGLRAGAPGFTPFRVQIEPGADTYFQNNTLAAFSLVSGPPRVLLVSADPQAATALQQALAAAGLDVAASGPEGLASELGALSRYASVVLVDTPAQAFSQRQLLALQSYVRDLGGGLVAVGGPHSYGVGGWFQTPLEETLPVEMQVKDPKRFPSIAYAVVMDESGSMAAEENGIAKYRLAAEAAARVAELMHEFDELTVIGFDTAPTKVIGPVPGTEKESAIPQIMAIGPGGGGIFVFEGLSYAHQQLLKSTKPTRHIILLADGADSESQTGAHALVQRFHEQDEITLTVVAIGDGQDVKFLREIAALGGGRFHLTDRAANLPAIFAQEAAEIQRNYVVEEPFNVVQRAPSPILSGITSAPQLLGYVATTAKPAAQVVLAAPEDDPVLAQWQYGLGRAVAFTSDATGRWATHWVSWEHFARFWAQAVRWTIREDAQQNLEPSVAFDGEQAQVAVDARDNLGATLNGLTLTLRLVSPGLAVGDVSLRQVAPGRYAGSFQPAEEGPYFITLTGARAAAPGAPELALIQRAGWVNPYSPEYRVLDGGSAGLATLRQLAAITGGGVLETPAAAFVHNLPGERGARDVWPWLLGAAALLLPLDVALRRLVVSRYDIERALARARQALRLPGAPARETERETAMARLFAAKTRVEQTRSGVVEPPAPSVTRVTPPPAAPASAPPPASGARPTAERPTGEPPTAERPAAKEPAPAGPAEADDTLAARLLKKKRGSGGL